MSNSIEMKRCSKLIKKKWIINVGLLCLFLAFSGCLDKETTEKSNLETPTLVVTLTIQPIPSVTVAPKPSLPWSSANYYTDYFMGCMNGQGNLTLCMEFASAFNTSYIYGGEGITPEIMKSEWIKNHKEEIPEECCGGKDCSINLCKA